MKKQILKKGKKYLYNTSSWLVVVAIIFSTLAVVLIPKAGATTSGTMKLYFHKENSDVNETYNSMGLTPPEPAADTVSATTSTANVNATPPTSFCESSGNTTDKLNDIGADSQAVANRCMATFISAPVGAAISMSTGDAASITGQFWSSESTTQVASAMNIYIYRWTSGTTVTSGNRIATLTCAEPGTTATSCVPTAIAPANNITFAASDRVIAIVSMNVTTLRSGSNVQVYFDSTARAASMIKMSYTVLGSDSTNKPSLAGTLDDDFTTNATTTACNTSGVAYNTKWTCLQGSATSTAGNFNAAATSSPTGDSSSWLWLQNQTTATSATVSNFGTTPSNTFLYQGLPGAYGNGNITTVINSSGFYDIGSTPTNSASPYSHSGLVLWTSNTDYLEIQVYSDGAINDTGTNKVHVALNTNGTISGAQNLDSATTANSFNNIWVRFVNTSGSWQAQYSTDGASFTNVGSAVAHSIFTRAGLNSFAAIANPVMSYAGAFEWFQSTLASPSYNQAAYRWYQNADSTTPGTVLAANNTTATLTSAGQQFRLRTLLSATNAQVGSSAQSFNLQYAALGANASCSAVSSGNYSSIQPDGSSWSQAASSTSVGGWQTAPMLTYNNKMWIIGGSPGGGAQSKDVWSSTDGVTWNHLTSSAAFGLKRSSAAVVFNNEMWVMGGRASSIGTVTHDVWHSSDGITWNQATSAAGWSARELLAATVYNGEIWVMGGDDGASPSTLFHDVWHSSDGITWNQATSAAGWSARDGLAALTYNGALWVMGGETGTHTVINDVWTSTNGSSWTQKSSSAFSAARKGIGAVVFNGKMYAIGGDDDALSTTYYSDVYSSTDGQTWNTVTSGAGFSARTNFLNTVYNNQIWVMGGQISGGSAQDVWNTPLPLIAYYDNPTPASGSNISTTANDPIDSGQTINAQTYQESDGFTNSQSTYGLTEDAIWDLSLYDNGAPAATTYCFRIVKSDGTILSTYTNYPSITTFSPGPTTDQILRGGQWFNNGAKQAFYWAQ